MNRQQQYYKDNAAGMKSSRLSYREPTDECFGCLFPDDCVCDSDITVTPYGWYRDETQEGGEFPYLSSHERECSNEKCGSRIIIVSEDGHSCALCGQSPPPSPNRWVHAPGIGEIEINAIGEWV